MTLHPFIEGLLAQLRASGVPAFSAGTPDAARAQLARSRAFYGTGPAMAMQDLVIPGRTAGIPARLYRPTASPSGLFVHFHGGGWVLGALDDFDAFARTLAARSGAAVLLVDYRLAPEHPYPAGLEDAIDALAWAWSTRPAGDVPLAVGGDSAGANLATVAARRLAGRIALCGQVLVYPVTDGAMDSRSYAEESEGMPLTAGDMAWFFGHYGAADPLDADVSPLRAPNVAMLPPTFVLTAEHDVLRDEGEAYAGRLARAGVDVVHRRYEGTIHGFIRLHNLFEVADGAVTDIADFIRRAAATETT